MVKTGKTPASPAGEGQVAVCPQRRRTDRGCARSPVGGRVTARAVQAPESHAGKTGRQARGQWLPGARSGADAPNGAWTAGGCSARRTAPSKHMCVILRISRPPLLRSMSIRREPAPPGGGSLCLNHPHHLSSHCGHHGAGRAASLQPGEPPLCPGVPSCPEPAPSARRPRCR